MRILLIRAPVPPHTIGLKHIMICEPLELEYVAAKLNGHEVQIMDLILERGLRSRLEAFQPDIVGTGSYISGVNEAIKVCRAVRSWNPSVWTVIGGVHASRVPEDYVDCSVDVIVQGDGTTIMPEIVRAIAAGQPLEDVPGLILLRDGVMHRTAEMSYMPDPDTLPLPRRDLVEHLKHRYYYLFHQPVATIKTTWGCWYKCNFCFTWRITGGHPYARSAVSIADELEQLDCEHVYIVDDIFLIHPTRLRELADLLRARNIRKKYLVYARADFIAENQEIIAEWAELGLQAVFVGIEAATNPELDSMDKETSVDQNRQAIAVLQRCGVDIYASLIVHPDYAESDWRRLKTFIDENKLFYLNVSPLTPMPGTLIWDEYKDRVNVPRNAHGLWDLSHTVIQPRQSLKTFYRSLLGVYAHACLNPLRARRLGIKTAPPVFSLKFLRLWIGGLKIAVQFLRAHRHHEPKELARASSKEVQENI